MLPRYCVRFELEAYNSVNKAGERGTMSYREVSEVRDGMQIDWDVPIRMEDGVVLRADVYRPVKRGRYPVIMTYGPYGKWLHFEDGSETAWRRMVENHPDVPNGSTNKYQNWEGEPFGTSGWFSTM